MSEKYSMYTYIKLLAFSLCVLLFCFLLSFSSVAAGNNKRVLFISSYSESFLSVPDQINGIKSVLEPLNIDCDIEYMDMQRFDTEDNLQHFYESIKYKLANTTAYDAVIVGDDAALQFALDYQEELFFELPIVFLCINDETRGLNASANAYMTGAMEITDSLQETINIAKILRPNATKLTAIVDNSLTGLGDQKQFANEALDFPELEASVLNSSDYSFEEFGKVLETVGDDTILLYMCMFKDNNNEFMDINPASEFIAQHTNVPVFRHSIGGVGNGLLGGKMVDYYASGVVAAEMVVSIFDGTPISSIEMISMSPDKYVFDYDVMQKYDINKRLIPNDATILNREVNIFEAYKKTFIILTGIFILLLGVSAVLFWDNIRRRSILNRITEMHKQIEFQASHDYLTQLPNRLAFTQQLGKEISAGNQGAVLLIDIDNFKDINDTLGHIYGDKVLVEVSKKLAAISHEEFFVSRLGGDEFLILLYGTQEEATVAAYARKIIALFSEATDVERQENFLSCSIGITTFPNDSEKVEQLIMFADTAMYKVKNEGKNNFMFYSSELSKEFADKVEVGNILRQALKTDGFLLNYQPLVDAQTLETTGFEALLRLKNHSISPGIFIPVAEESGLIVEIGRWVASEAIRQISESERAGLSPKMVSINFSNVQLRDEGFISYLEQLFARYNVSPELLEVEITESILLRKTDKALGFLHELKALGVNLALDDFGTGYSSLNYLTYIPVDKVKLDKSLIDKFLTRDDNTFIKNIISLLHGLNVKITAEGIEELEQFEDIKDAGCDTIQGYFFSKPLMAKDACEVISKVWPLK